MYISTLVIHKVGLKLESDFKSIFWYNELAAAS